MGFRTGSTVQVDNATIEKTSGDVVRVKDGGISNVKISDVASSKVTGLTGQTAAQIKALMEAAADADKLTGAALQANAGILATQIAGAIADGVDTKTGTGVNAPAWLPFGGRGGDGVLTVSSGTTNLTGNAWKEYSQIDIESGATLSTTGTGDTGKLLIKCSGNCHIHGTINLAGKGYAGGGVGAAGTGNGICSGGLGENGANKSGGGGGSYANEGGNGHLQSPNQTVEWTSKGTPASGPYLLGGSGGGGDDGGVVGGAGGGVVYIEVMGDLIFDGAINAQGVAGGNGGVYAGGGGGGGGVIIIRVNGAITNSGTTNVAGGAGGTSTGHGAGGAGGNGYMMVGAV